MGTDKPFPGGPLAGQATAAKPTALSPPHIPPAPQLSVALNTSPVDPKEDTPDIPVDAAASIGKILEQIHARLAAGLGNFRHHFLRGRGVSTFAAYRGTDVVDHDFCAGCRHRQRELAPDAAARARDYDDFSLKHAVFLHG